MFIAGTRDLNDAADDVLRIPYYGNSRNIQRDQDARDELMKHPEVTQITGHSLGASTALQLPKDYKHIQGTRTYGAPVLNITPHIGPPERSVDRYRSYGDPISSLDFKANSTFEFSSLNPFNNHSYDELGKKFETIKTDPISFTTPDGSTSLIA